MVCNGLRVLAELLCSVLIALQEVSLALAPFSIVVISQGSLSFQAIKSSFTPNWSSGASHPIFAGVLNLSQFEPHMRSKIQCASPGPPADCRFLYVTEYHAPLVQPAFQHSCIAFVYPTARTKFIEGCDYHGLLLPNNTVWSPRLVWALCSLSYCRCITKGLQYH